MAKQFRKETKHIPAIFREFSKNEYPNAEELRDIEAKRLSDEGYQVQTFFSIKADRKNSIVSYGLLATKKGGKK